MSSRHLPAFERQFSSSLYSHVSALTRGSELDIKKKMVIDYMQAQRETRLFDTSSYSLVVLLENVSPSQQALLANKGGRHRIIMQANHLQEV